MDFDLLVCTWNIRTLNRDGASAKLAKSLIKCGADIVQEMRWIGQGCKFQEDCNINYSCLAEKREFGCGFVVGQSLRHLMLGFTSVNEALAKIRIKAKIRNISLICAHTPTEVGAFYGCLLRKPGGSIRQMPGPRHHDCPRGFQCEGWARRYLWSHCQPPIDKFA